MDLITILQLLGSALSVGVVGWLIYEMRQVMPSASHPLPDDDIDPHHPLRR